LNNYEFLKIEQKDNILIITIDKQNTLNALNSKLLDEISDCFTKLNNRDDITVVIITGKGSAFVAGADISEMVDFTPAKALRFTKKGNDIFLEIDHSTKVVIAAINGYALGGGCELAMACDLRVASENAIFGQPEVGLGIIPAFGGTQRLPRLIGAAKAKELIYTGERITAKEALDIGLINYLVKPEELMDKALEIAEKISMNSRVGVMQAKRSINTGLQTDIATGIKIEGINYEFCFGYDEYKIGMEAFLNKKKPDYKHNRLNEEDGK
jgi:enoyl-CoA hydratase